MTPWINAQTDNSYCLVEKTELIRCKDCKHWTFDENGVDGTADGICDVLKILTDEAFYCAESVRK